jgi:hypothetical protein
VGGEGNDRVLGGDGSDNLIGGSGNDLVDGFRGADDITGGEGTDFLDDGPFRETAKDNLVGGDGSDVFLVRNEPAAKDVVVCGDGFDRVSADSKDVVAPDCEKVAVGRAAVAELFEELEEVGFFESFDEGLPPFPGE